jgi:antitoxin CcdA
VPAPAFDKSARKRPTNLTVNEDLLRQARELGINLSQAFEQKLEELVRAAMAERWIEENREAIEDYNRWVEKEGLWSDGHRLF